MMFAKVTILAFALALFCLEGGAAPNILLCIADDWGTDAGAYGNEVVKTPTFDRVAREGALFLNAFCPAPSCTPSRGSLLTGRAVHQLEEGGNLWGFLPKKFVTYPDLLEKNGYFIGVTRKGWGPGNIPAAGRSRNPAGPAFKDFSTFLKARPQNQPFCFWFGSQDPHRPYTPDSGLVRKDIAKVKVPPYWPDTQEVRKDILNYYYEVERFDQEVAELLKILEASGELENTIVIITSDNGLPFPRAKANLYDAGSREPLAIRWPAKFKPGSRVNDFVSLTDLAPTILEAAGVKPLPEMTGQSLLNIGKAKKSRDHVFLERERHANVRKGDLSYPARAVRTKDFLYIWNLHPDRWPAGDPEPYKAVGRFGDCDASPTKELILENAFSETGKIFFDLCFGKRPAEELYDLRTDPDQIVNLATMPNLQKKKAELKAKLVRWMEETGDPRAKTDDDRWEKYPYFGEPIKARSQP